MASTDDFTIAAALTPRNAAGVRTDLLAWLEAADRGRRAPSRLGVGQGCLELDTAERLPSATALQLILAACARADGPPPPLGPLAKAAVDALSKPHVHTPAVAAEGRS
ncbi:MAG: hypothetical protein AAF677_03260 [Pseudomonadota bacterium]